VSYVMSRRLARSSNGRLLLPTSFLTIAAVGGVEGAQSTVGVCALDL
jgi:hypothetical protein